MMDCGIDGYIVVNTYKDGKPETYIWEGGDFAYIDWRFLVSLGYRDFPEVFTVGEFKLAKVARPKQFGTRQLYVRIDGKWEWFRAIRNRIIYFLYDLDYKFLGTAIIWGLVEDEDFSKIPSWSDLKILKWFREKFNA